MKVYKVLKNGTKITDGNVLANEMHVIKYLKDKNDAYKYTRASESKIYWKCPICNFEINRMICDVVRRGFNCKKCSDKTSMPERIALSFLDSIGVDYEYQKVFNDLDNRIFDFYIPKHDIIIETNGEQHYKKESIYNYKRTKESDNEKEKYCKAKNISIYFINCSKVNVNAQINSLSEIKEFSEYTIDKKDIKHKLSIRSINKENINIFELYKQGYSTGYIANKHRCSKGKINNILNRMGSDIRKSGKPNRGVKCKTNGKTFSSVTKATQYAGLKNTINICDACKGKQKTAGRDPYTNSKLEWEYIQSINDIVWSYMKV